MYGAVPPLCRVCAWRGGTFKHHGEFLLYFYTLSGVTSFLWCVCVCVVWCVEKEGVFPYGT